MREINEKVEPKPIDLGDYQFGFHDDVQPIASTGMVQLNPLSVKCLASKESLNGC